ncbi:unnamed protein product [Caenorhabditis sp. 36 PRJEB53466]|nr:unnamed protein product [Caenorhabditis sp. 36 PRJEB53466]
MDQPVGDGADGSLGSVGRFHSTYGKKESADGPRQHGADDVEESDDVEGSSEGEEASRNLPLLMQAVTVAFRSVTRLSTLLQTAALELSRWRAGESLSELEWINLSETAQMAVSEVSGGSTPLMERKNPLTDRVNMELTMLKNLTTLKDLRKVTRLSTLLQTVALELSRWRAGESLSELEWINLSETAQMAVSEVSGGSTPLMERKNPLTDRVNMELTMLKNLTTLKDLRKVTRLSTLLQTVALELSRWRAGESLSELEWINLSETAQMAVSEVSGGSTPLMERKNPLTDRVNMELTMLKNLTTLKDLRKVTRLSTLLQTAALELSRWRAGESLSELEWINLSETAQMAVSEVSGGSTPLMERKNPLTDRVNMELTMLKNLTTLKDLRKAKRPQETSRS